MAVQPSPASPKTAAEDRAAAAALKQVEQQLLDEAAAIEAAAAKVKADAEAAAARAKVAIVSSVPHPHHPARAQIRLVCTHPGGVLLQALDRSVAVGGSPVTVDVGFWKAWLDDHPGSALISSGALVVC